MERRKFLTGTGALAGGLALSGSLLDTKKVIAKAFGDTENSAAATKLANYAKGTAQPLQTESTDLTPYTGPWTDTQLLHLLRRTMFGVPIAQYTAAKALGSMSGVVTKLTDMSSPLPVGPSWVNQYLPYVNGNQVQSGSNQNLELQRSQEIVNWWFDLMIKEDLSMREKMTYLWTNHFVTGWQTVQHAGYTYQYLQLLRKYALGNFKDFVYQVSIDPSMLIYLNGNQNYAKNVNENYAREVMELFTIGLIDPKTLQPNYTENDVQASAKALTGWVPTETAGASEPYFMGQFIANRHDSTDTETFLGDTGKLQLQDILNTIFGLGGGFNVAWFVCQKIYMQFVYYNAGTPGDGSAQQSVITAMANLLIASNWELKPVVTALLSSAHFYDPNVIGAQLKSPTEFMASFFRDFGMTYGSNNTFNPADPPDSGKKDARGSTVYSDTNPDLSLVTAATIGTLLGQQLLNPPNVKGWPGGENWISTGTFQDRQGIALTLLANFYTGKEKGGYTFVFDPVGWAESYPNYASLKDSALATALENIVLALPLGPIESEELLLAIDPNAQDFYLEAAPITAFTGIMANLPEFQLT
jgi:uncharacterized protein (DUF1800 family)